jgi:hypothetical protein
VGGSAVPLSVTSTAAVAKVEFTVDGDPVVTSTSTSSPYTATWDPTSVVDGTHYVAARITDTQGRVNTTNVAAVNVNTPAQPGATFGLDGSTSVDGRGTQTTPTLTGLHGGDVLLAFVSSDGPERSSQTSTVTGSGTSWSLVRRANTEAGTAEIWKAVLPSNASTGSATATPAAGGYDQSVTLSAFTGSLGIGASSASSAGTGAPSTSLTATAAGSWTWGVGNDWDGAAARTVGSGQVVRHQWVDTAVGDTFWVQSQTGRSSASGSTVTTNDTLPTNHRWNLASVEVVAADTTPPPPDTQAPTVSISDPHAGDTVSGTVALGATAADNVGVTDVTFSVDGSTIGTPDTAPPFMTSWDSRTMSAGSHTIRAVARDAAGNATTSAPVTVTVDNSAPPPAVIGIDKQVVVKAKGTLTAPALTTTSSGDEVLAMVAMDGPNSARAQSATVSGGGLTWTLVKRANTQSGVSEIWAAKATGKLTSAVVKATPARSGYDGQLSVIALANAAGTNVAGAGGAPLGAPSIYLPGVAAGSWVFAVGNDWDRAVARTPVSGQVLQQQWVDSGTGDTFWVQSTSAPNIALSLVTIADSAPTNDQWNYAAVEVTAAPAS